MDLLEQQVAQLGSELWYWVRAGHLVGSIAKLMEFNIPQGKRNASHLLGVTTRPLCDPLALVVPGAGVGVPPAAAMAWRGYAKTLLLCTALSLHCMPSNLSGMRRSGNPIEEGLVGGVRSRRFAPARARALAIHG